MKDVKIYLEQDIRMDMDEFHKMDATLFEDHIKVGKKADSISTLLKFLRQFRHIPFEREKRRIRVRQHFLPKPSRRRFESVFGEFRMEKSE